MSNTPQYGPSHSPIHSVSYKIDTEISAADVKNILKDREEWEWDLSKKIEQNNWEVIIVWDKTYYLDIAEDGGKQLYDIDLETGERKYFMYDDKIAKFENLEVINNSSICIITWGSQQWFINIDSDNYILESLWTFDSIQSRSQDPSISKSHWWYKVTRDDTIAFVSVVTRDNIISCTEFVPSSELDIHTHEGRVHIRDYFQLWKNAPYRPLSRYVPELISGTSDVFVKRLLWSENSEDVFQLWRFNENNIFIPFNWWIHTYNIQPDFNKNGVSVIDQKWWKTAFLKLSPEGITKYSYPKKLLKSPNSSSLPNWFKNKNIAIVKNGLRWCKVVELLDEGTFKVLLTHNRILRPRYEPDYTFTDDRKDFLLKKED